MLTCRQLKYPAKFFLSIHDLFYNPLVARAFAEIASTTLRLCPPEMPSDLKDHYLANIGTVDNRTVQQICQGNPNDIAYAKLISLLETHDVVDIVRMTTGNPHLNKPMTNQGLGRRIQIAAKYFAGQQGKTLDVWRSDLNTIRQQNGLKDLAASWVWENGKVPQHLRHPSGRKAGSLSAAYSQGLTKTAPARRWRKTVAPPPQPSNYAATNGDDTDDDEENPFEDLEAAAARDDIPTTELAAPEQNSPGLSVSSPKQGLYMEMLAPRFDYTFAPTSSPAPSTPTVARPRIRIDDLLNPTPVVASSSQPDVLDQDSVDEETEEENNTDA